MPFEYEDKFEYEDASSSEEAKSFWARAPKWVKAPVAAGEAALSMIGGIPSQIAGGLGGLGTLIATGDLDAAGAVTEGIQKDNFGFGQYTGSTELGKEYAENLGKAFAKPGELAGDLGAAIGKPFGKEDLGRLSLQLPTDTFMNFLPLGGVAAAAKGAAGKTVKALGPRNKAAAKWEAVPEKPIVDSPFDPDVYLSDPLTRAKFNAADEAQVARLEATLNKRNQPQQTMLADQSGNVESLRPDQVDNVQAMIDARTQFEKQTEAQKAIERRQSAMEQSVAREQNLSFNAAERARQENAPTGYAQYVAEQARAEFPEAYREVQLAELAVVDAKKALKQAETDRQVLAARKRQADAQAVLEARHRALETQMENSFALRNEGRERVAPEVVGESPTGRSPVSAMDELTPSSISERVRRNEEESVAWKQRGQERLAENIAERSAYETQVAREQELIPLEQRLREDAYVPVYDGQGPKTRAFKALQGKGNKQRGAVDFNEISKAVSDVLKSADRYTSKIAPISIDKLAPKDNADFAREIPGMGKVLDKVVLRPESAETLISKALKEADIPAISKDIAMGPELIGEKYKNSLTAGVSKWLQWADKKSDLAYRELVKPVEKTVANLSPDSLATLAEGLKKEMFRKERFTDAELSQVLSPVELKAYKQLRDSFDTVYELQKKNLEAQGRRVPTKGEAYLASMRGGNYHVAVKAADGKPLWHIQARTKWEANKATEWLKKNVPEAKDVGVEYRSSNIGTNIPKDVLGSFQELAKLLDDGDMASAAIQDAIRKAQEDAGYTFRGQDSRFMNKQNVRGFEGDMPWLSEKQNTQRLLQNQIEYLKNSYDWAYMQEALGQVKEVLADPTLIQEKPNAVDYIKDVVRQQIGMGDHFTRGAEEYVMSKMGLSRSLLNQAAGKTGRLTSLLQLGASVGYMIATPLTALYSVGLHLKEGTLGFKTVTNSLLDFSAGITNNLLHDAGKAERMPMTELGREALKYAEDNGIIVKNMFGDLDRIGKNNAANAALGIYEGTITVPEKIQRLSTFMSFVHGLKAKGEYKNMYELFQRAETLTNVAATNFRNSELPMGVQKFGVLGAAAFKYKAPLLNYYHQLHMLSLEAQKGNVKPLLGLLGMTAVLGGVQNLPGMNEVDAVWNMIKKGVANASPENYDKVKDVSVKGFVQQNLPESVAFGAVQSALGAQMSQRFGTDLTNLENPLENAFPVASMAGNVLGAAGDLAKGNLAGAAWNMAPPLGKGLLEANSDAFKAPNRAGGFVKASDAGDTAKLQITRNSEDLAKRNLGLRSSSEAAQLEARARENKEALNVKTASEKLINNLVNKASRGKRDQLDTYARAWVKLNPDGDINGAINGAIKDSTLTPEEQKLAANGSLDAMLRAKKILDAKRRNP